MGEGRSQVWVWPCLRMESGVCEFHMCRDQGGYGECEDRWGRPDRTGQTWMIRSRMRICGQHEKAAFGKEGVWRTETESLRSLFPLFI